LQHPSAKVEDFEGRISRIQNEVGKLHSAKEKILKRFSEFKETLVLKIATVEKQLDECVKAKDTYSNFVYSDLSSVEIASYALCAILTTLEVVKDRWEKDMENLKIFFDDCMKFISA
jgi:hypothetical protein